MTWRRWAFHPILVALFPTLLLYSRNVNAVAVSDVWLPLGLTLGATAVAWGALRAIRLDASRAAPIVSAALILFFSFGLGVRLTAKLGLSRDRNIREYATLAAEAVALASVVGFVFWKPDRARSLNGPLNAASIALAGLSVAGLVGQTGSDRGTPPPRIVQPVAPKVAPGSGRLPDVYFLVLDAYGRSDVLKDAYGFDNGAFLDRLERKGFVVARRSTANYCQTALSLAATLNLRYLDDLAGNRSPSRLPLKQLIVESAVFQAFRQQGYRLVTFASGLDATEGLGADLTLAPSSNLRTFHTLLADQTPLWLLLGQRSIHEPHRMHRDRILEVFDDLPSASHPSSRPTLTFAHVVAPHPPFVFGADGRDASGVERAYTLNDSEGWCRIEGHGGPDDYIRRYRDQITYITSRVEEAVDRILATSPGPPIIIIQGDHGPGSHFDSGSEQPNDLLERMSILNACYLPEAGRCRIDDSITPVNTMRVVVDECLGSKLGRLEDRNYYSTFLAPYVFTDVTGQIEPSGK